MQVIWNFDCYMSPGALCQTPGALCQTKPLLICLSYIESMYLFKVQQDSYVGIDARDRELKISLQGNKSTRYKIGMC